MAMQTENIFEVFLCTGRQKVFVAAYMFQGAADTWWKTVREPYYTIEHATIWEMFTKQLNQKSVPEHIKEHKFSVLKQLK